MRFLFVEINKNKTKMIKIKTGNWIPLSMKWNQRQNLVYIKRFSECLLRYDPYFVFYLQSHHGGLWKCEDCLQQQLQSFWEVHPASLLREWKHPGRLCHRLYPDVYSIITTAKRQYF